METKLKTPIKVEVDQTGYLKSVETGMYLVDGSGDGFELGFKELSKLK